MWGGVGVIIAMGIGWQLYRKFLTTQTRKQVDRNTLFAAALKIIDEPVFEQQGAQEFPCLSGKYRGFSVQVKPVVDTLATRRLPALWLLVTLQDALPLKARFDMMMRPAGPTTFSNFDLLPETLKLPAGFPELAVIRTDNANQVLPAELIRPHLAPFFGLRAKELLITENGLRMVWLLAEADRVRYGVFRQAEFGSPQIDPDVLTDIFENLIAIRKDILDWTAKKND
jgi:hypothetical protein